MRVSTCLYIPVLCLLITTHAVWGDAYSAKDCDGALVKSTYNSFSTDHLDSRIASFVSEKEYNEIKQDFGVSAIIYGVPVGANYGDFQKSVGEKVASFSSSLSRDQTRNILWTGIDPNSPGAYQACLDATVFSSRGLHLAVISATTSDLAVAVAWHPEGGDSPTIHPHWEYRTMPDAKFPTTVVAGTQIVVIGRPKIEQTLGVNYLGSYGKVVIEPISKLPFIPQPAQLTATTETYSPPQLASGACEGFGGYQDNCTPDKPVGWTIQSSTFQMVGDRAGCTYAECSKSVDNSTKVCWRYRTQGHNEQCGHNGNTGIQYSSTNLTVTWLHR